MIKKILLYFFCIFTLLLSAQPTTDNSFTAQEIEWLNQNKNTIKYAPNPFWPPADYLELDTIHKGIISEYIKLFEKKLDLKFQKVYLKNWSDIYNGAKKSEVDFFGGIQKTKEREIYFNFTDIFLTVPLTILVKNNYPEPLTDENISKMRLACVKDYSSLEHVRNTYPGITIIECEDDLSALLKTSLGETDGTIIDLLSASYIVEKYGINNLSLGKQLDYTWELSFAIRKDLPELASILNKILTTINEEVRHNIFNKWVSITNLQQKKFTERNAKTIAYSLISVSILLIITFLVSVFLKKQITKQTLHLKIAKEKAEESETQLKLIANNFVNGMIYQVITLDENKRKFTYLSESVKTLYGCTAQEAIDNPDIIYSKIHPDDINILMKAEKEALMNLSIFNKEVRAINPDGSIRWSRYVSKPRIIDNLTYWDGIEIDITEIKQNETELKIAKEKAVESDHLKSAFLANMSHEIRTPMNAIIGFTRLLKKPNLSEEKKEEFISYILKSGDILLKLINDIIDISQIESSMLNMHYEQIKVNEILNEVLNFYQIIPSKDEKFEINLNTPEFSENLSINTDRVRLKQLLNNLIDNTIKYGNGKIEFGYNKSDNENIEFYVKDNGEGISKDKYEKIFERFFQLNYIQNIGGIKGVGLGLSICKLIIENLKGEIWLESEVGSGTTFYFKIPKA